MPSEFVLRFTPADLGTLDKALGSLPYKDVAALIQRINRQIAEQIAEQNTNKNDGPQDDAG